MSRRMSNDMGKASRGQWRSSRHTTFFSPMWMRPMGSAEEVRERLLWAASLTCSLKLCLRSPIAHWPAACMSQAFPFLARKIISRHDQSWLSFRPLSQSPEVRFFYCTVVYPGLLGIAQDASSVASELQPSRTPYMDPATQPRAARIFGAPPSTASHLPPKHKTALRLPQRPKSCRVDAPERSGLYLGRV